MTESTGESPGTSSGHSFIKLLNVLFAILSLVDSIVFTVRASQEINDGTKDSYTNQYYAIVLMIIRFVAIIQYLIFYAISVRRGLNDTVLLISSLAYTLTISVVMLLSCFVIDFREASISLMCHIIATYLSLGVYFHQLVDKFLDKDREKHTKQSKSGFQKVLNIFNKNLLALSTLITVLIAVAVGLIIREMFDEWSPRSIKYVGFIGELFLRMLKCLILPLIFSSLVFAMANIDIRLSGKIGIKTVIYYLFTTVLAIILGIILVLSIRPGVGVDQEEEGESDSDGSDKLTTLDTIMDLVRNIFPDNLIEACLSSYKTVLVPPNVTHWNETDINTWEIKSGKTNGTNILGIVVFAIVFGIIVGKMGESGKALVEFFRLFNDAMMTMTEIVITVTPIAVLFLVLPQILGVKDLNELLGGVGWYTLTVLLGLFIHGLIVLPASYLIMTRKNPYKFLTPLSSALMTAFGTASSSATMPVTLMCLEERLKIDKRVTRFCIPVGATINMDGTALYEAVAAIFIAQYRGIDLEFVEVVIICITATAASIGAAGIPQAGLITMIIVLNAVGLPVEDAVLIYAVDWLIDRIRTPINVLGDAYGAGIIYHLSQDDLKKFDI